MIRIGILFSKIRFSLKLVSPKVCVKPKKGDIQCRGNYKSLYNNKFKYQFWLFFVTFSTFTFSKKYPKFSNIRQLFMTKDFCPNFNAFVTSRRDLIGKSAPKSAEIH